MNLLLSWNAYNQNNANALSKGASENARCTSPVPSQGLKERDKLRTGIFTAEMDGSYF